MRLVRACCPCLENSDVTMSDINACMVKVTFLCHGLI